MRVSNNKARQYVEKLEENRDYTDTICPSDGTIVERTYCKAVRTMDCMDTANLKRYFNLPADDERIKSGRYVTITIEACDD